MSETTNLNLPYLAAAQAQKHVTVNEALARLDAAVQLSVESRTLGTPPLVVVEGESYLVPHGAVNEWEEAEGQVTSYLNGSWQFFEPLVGWQIWVEDEVTRLTFDGSKWVENVMAMSVSNAAMRAEVIETDFVLAGGGDTELTGYVIPANTSVLAVTGRVLSSVTGDLTDWSLGIEGAETRYGSGLGLGQGAWLRGITGHPVTYYNATQLKLTANGGDFSGGTVRLAIHVIQFDLPDGDSL